MSIEKYIDQDKNLTTFKASGILSFDEFGEAIEGFYAAGPTDFVILDFSEAEGTGLQYTSARLTQLVRFAEANRIGQEEGKTAIVVSKEVHYDLGRMVEAFTEDRPIQYRVFYERGEAEKWLFEKD
jgi:hypothetical protein